MALCRGQAIDVLQWLGERRTPFTERDLRRELELNKRAVNRWLADLEDRALVKRVGYSHGDGGRMWVSEVTFRRRPATPVEQQARWWANEEA